MERIIGKYGPPESDTLIICIGGMHGNEPAGVKALEKVFNFLFETRPPAQGRFIGIRGNISAINKGKRLLHEDLNRIWSGTHIQLARENFKGHSPEIEELTEIFKVLDEIPFQNYKQKIFIDLHTTSGDNGTFVVAVDYQNAKHLMDSFKVPIILGLDGELESPAIRYFARQGFISFAFEGGLHQSPQSVNNLTWGIWQSLSQSGLISSSFLPDLSEVSQHLHQRFSRLPSILHLDYLHKIHVNDNFKMKLGFKNFDKIQYGQTLAEDKNGPIYAQSNGYLLMPLYQSQGNDGFFLVRSLENVN
jgi:succinylglutamate desuccinylase